MYLLDKFKSNFNQMVYVAPFETLTTFEYILF